MGFFKFSTLLLFTSSLSYALYENGSVIAPCGSPLYCQGDILKDIELAQPFSDSKTFVDLPTLKPLDEVIAAFSDLKQPIKNDSALQNFLTTYFGQAGSELAPVPTDQLKTSPDFLDNVNSSTVRSFLEKVIDIWPDLTRTYVGSANCSGCVSSFIPLNRTFVVAGGRFREAYYWDSYWIVRGLLLTKGSFTKIALNIIENFLDLVDLVGFVPNGSRQYYLNRSQPPLLAMMVQAYIEATNDKSVLERALPILEKEYNLWINNRTMTVKKGGKSYKLNGYQVLNNQPRPESYREDYITANNNSYYSASGIIYPETKPLTEAQKELLYANLAAGAQSGMDYSSRWLKTPFDASRDVYFPLRSLNVEEIVPIDLNSILYANEIIISGFHKSTGNNTAASAWAKLASARSEAMYTIMWNDEHNRYFDYNMTSKGQNVLLPKDPAIQDVDDTSHPSKSEVYFAVAQYYPFWTGAAPDFLKSNPTAVRLAYQPVANLLAANAGGIPATNFASGQQWDEPNVWPPLQYVLMNGLLNTPSTFGTSDPSYTWTRKTALEIAQRYVDSAFCTWRATGGSTPDFPKLAGAQSDGIVFEKYNSSTINGVGGGGEYQVVEGFGWTNGVLLWAGDVFGKELKTPDCGNITAATGGQPAKRKRAPSAVELHEFDARWVKDFKQSK
ncbi:trehalase [Rhizodiscina lignyota]|uniref:Trehalase n=1 Tax=Rhizodiscina lignyota TaxID=1504668 RepID=A0A9P4I8I7_9PEZI|nr:trehalase [Rhizodiscina lignyota]